MADADEDAARGRSVEATQVETDLSDETQDFRLLNHLSFLSDASSATLPRRGEKDFEPNPTEFQADVLASSRQAMHNALAHPRLHHPKGKLVAIYAPDGPPTASDLNSTDQSQTTPQNRTGKALVSPDACVHVPNPKGTHFKTMGQSDSFNGIWLLPEEALYMIERGTLDIRWPASHCGPTPANNDSDDADEKLSIPMSVQAAYACLLGRGGLTLERLSVFTGLRRLGYAVLRAPGWDDAAGGMTPSQKDAYQQQLRGPGLGGILGRLYNWINDPMSTASTAAGSVVGCGIHRSYSDIYRKLAIIPWYDPVLATERDPLDTDVPFRVVFHVYKPSTALKKTALPPPDFRIAVVNAREQTSIPTLAQISALLESTPLDPPRGGKMDRLVYMRLRHGYRNVVLAVVDQGVVSYIRVADAAFGKEKLFEGTNNGPSAPKRHGNFQGKKR